MWNSNFAAEIGIRALNGCWPWRHFDYSELLFHKYPDSWGIIILFSHVRQRGKWKRIFPSSMILLHLPLSPVQFFDHETLKFFFPTTLVLTVGMCIFYNWSYNSPAIRSFYNPDFFLNANFTEVEILSEGLWLEGLNPKIWTDYIRYYRTYIVNTPSKLKVA